MAEETQNAVTNGKDEKLRKGWGKIVKIEIDVPFLLYEYTYEEKTCQMRFARFDPTAMQKIKSGEFKPGDKIQVQYRVVNKDGDKELVDIDHQKKITQKKAYSDPTVELVKILSDHKIAVLQEATYFVRTAMADNVPDDLIKTRWSLVQELTQSGSYDLCDLIEKKIKEVKA